MVAAAAVVVVLLLLVVVMVAAAAVVVVVLLVVVQAGYHKFIGSLCHGFGQNRARIFISRFHGSTRLGIGLFSA